MAVVSEIIRVESDNTLSFGNYLATDKQKFSDFKLGGDIYKIKTHNELTRCERNDKMLLETVPGTTIHNFGILKNKLTFAAEGAGNTQFTIGLEPNSEYQVFVDDNLVGKTNSGISGKINFGAELNTDLALKMLIEKV